MDFINESTYHTSVRTRTHVKLDVVVYICNPSVPTMSRELEAGEFPEALMSVSPSNAAVNNKRPCFKHLGRTRADTQGCPLVTHVPWSSCTCTDTHTHTLTTHTLKYVHTNMLHTNQKDIVKIYSLPLNYCYKSHFAVFLDL